MLFAWISPKLVALDQRPSHAQNLILFCRHPSLNRSNACDRSMTVWFMLANLLSLDIQSKFYLQLLRPPRRVTEDAQILMQA